MTRILVMLAVGVGMGLAGWAAAHPPTHGTVNVKSLATQDIVEKLDGNVTKAAFLEVTLEPGQADLPHRHAGPVFGYVLEGEFEWAIDDQPAKVLRAGETFYEPTGCLHREAKNPAAKGITRLLAVILHPRDAKQVTIPEPRQK
ncbi:MAG: cupin domain-containing protein [Pirellulaceae bacterium]|nr:cupin domain-containing protein [Pirellulaceae bacterium]